jgi:hypothetical protein
VQEFRAGLVDLIECGGRHGGVGHVCTCTGEGFVGLVAEHFAQVGDRGVDLGEGGPREGGRGGESTDGSRRFVVSEAVEASAVNL